MSKLPFRRFEQLYGSREGGYKRRTTDRGSRRVSEPVLVRWKSHFQSKPVKWIGPWNPMPLRNFRPSDRGSKTDSKESHIRVWRTNKPIGEAVPLARTEVFKVKGIVNKVIVLACQIGFPVVRRPSEAKKKRCRRGQGWCFLTSTFIRMRVIVNTQRSTAPFQGAQYL